MATGYMQAKFETNTPGNESNTPTLSTKTFYPPLTSAALGLNPTHLNRDDELRNSNEPLSVLPEVYNPSWGIEQRMYPDALGFWLTLILGQPTTATGDGVITDQDTTAIPVGAYRHRWTAPFGPTGASPYTAQLQYAYKDQSVFFKAKGAAAEELSIENPVTGGSRIAANGPALYMDRIADPSRTPSYESLAVRPFTRGNLTLPTWLSGTGTHENFDLNISNPVETVRSMGIASKWPDVMEKAEGPITITGSLPQRQLDADDYNALRDATGFSAVAKWVSESIIASSYPYKFYCVMDNCQYVDLDLDDLTNRRRHGASFDWKATSDGAGASVLFELVNSTSNYA